MGGGQGETEVELIVCPIKTPPRQEQLVMPLKDMSVGIYRQTISCTLHFPLINNFLFASSTVHCEKIIAKQRNENAFLVHAWCDIIQQTHIIYPHRKHSFSFLSSFMRALVQLLLLVVILCILQSVRNATSKGQK